MKILSKIVHHGRGSYWIRSGAMLLFNRLSVSAFGFLSFFMLLRMLDKAEYGVWILFLSVTAVIELIKAGFIKNPLIKFSQQEQQKTSILSASLLLNISITIVFSVALLLLSGILSQFWHQDALQELFRLYIIIMLLLIPLHHFDYIQQAHFSFKGTLISESCRQLIFFGAIAYYFLVDQKLTLNLLVWIQVIAVLVSTITSFFFAKRYLAFQWQPSAYWFRKLGSYGKYTFGSSVSAMLMRNTDSWMLGRMVSSSAVAAYNPAIRIANFMEIPALTLSTSLFPKLSQRMDQEGPEAARYLYERSVGVILSCVLPVVLLGVLFARPITWLIAGEEYLDTAPILRVTVLYSLLLPLNRQLGVTLEAMGLAKLNFLFVIRNAVLNLVFNFFFIRYFGIIGAAYGTLLTYVIATVLNQIYLAKTLQVKILNIFRYIFSSYTQLYQLGMNQWKQ